MLMDSEARIFPNVGPPYAILEIDRDGGNPNTIQTHWIQKGECQSNLQYYIMAFVALLVVGVLCRRWRSGIAN